MPAWRYGFQPGMLMPPPGGAIQEAIRQETGLDFNGGRPMPPATWMADEEESELDNITNTLVSVIPVHAMMAASLLAHPPEGAMR